MIKKLLERTSVRSYIKDKKLDKETYNKLIEVINSSPSSTNGNAFTAIIIEDKNTLQELKELTSIKRDQQFIVDGSLLVIFCADFNRRNYAAAKSNIEYEKEYQDWLTIAIGDTYIGASFFMNAAISLGLGTCFLGSIRVAHKFLKEKLNLSGQIIPLVGVVVGYSDNVNEIKPKLNKVYKEKYDLNQVKKEIDQYDQTVVEYLKNRKTNARETNWSEPHAKVYLDTNYFDKCETNYLDWKNK
ncbi:nitroreductase family protein [Malacoplasma iowae]|uniref:Nitroreductase family protein n=1 Tax=Malacoplasma iowae 695 TaxID=1048830 RepID=A0A6P1LHK4_MALIO|nr:nitroreductase family protein [Malacoplasma iowae]VEU63201.1 putative NADPH-dependent oxidoreductase [Mycoplasmopsis fermentans]EGZ31043.1 NADPH flavin oxidoreductase [Malacoplasma iowae 695]QHG89575.1 nitroreductase family protein [Malacoplasma iowae 695]WPL35646.1 nitroreductase family protein [Malacoplasma iowae]WPL36822.1 nitroreductase family protein [Malacoplasma iowae]